MKTVSNVQFILFMKLAYLLVKLVELNTPITLQSILSSIHEQVYSKLPSGSSGCARSDRRT